MYLYDTTTYTYTNIEDYLSSIEDSAGDVSRLLMLYTMDSLFEDTKKRTAWRGRYAKDDQGRSQLDRLQITDDERDMFDDLMKRGSAKVFMVMSAYAKNIAGAYRYNVKFGDPVVSGSVISGGATAVLTDTDQSLTVNELAGYKLVITSAGLAINQERTILSNTADTITLESAFDVDVDGMEYAVMTQTDDFIIFYLDMNLQWDLNMLLGASEAAREAMVTWFVWQWYLMNRYMDDAAVELSRFETELTELRRCLGRRKEPIRRSGEII